MLIACLTLNVLVLCLIFVMFLTMCSMNAEISSKTKEIGIKQEHFESVLQTIQANSDEKIKLVLNLQDNTLKTIQDNRGGIDNSLLNVQSNIEKRMQMQMLLYYAYYRTNQHCNEIKFQQLLDAILLANNSLSNQNKHWVLEKDGTRKFFKPGKIVKIEDDTSKTETSYEYDDDKVFCTVKIDGVLKSKIQFNSFGSPLHGEVYDSEGNIIQKFKYNELGQVEKSS